MTTTPGWVNFDADSSNPFVEFERASSAIRGGDGYARENSSSSSFHDGAGEEDDDDDSRKRMTRAVSVALNSDNEEEEEEEEEGNSSATRRKVHGDEDEEERARGDDKPPIPVRPTFAHEMVIRARQSAANGGQALVFQNDAALISYLYNPLAEIEELMCKVSYSPSARTFHCVHAATQRVLMIATKRRDGLKMLSLTSNYSICVIPARTEQAVTYDLERQALGHNVNAAASLLEPMRIAKLRSLDVVGSQYAVYDNTGKSSKEARGAVEAPREVAAVAFSVVKGIYTRRAANVIIPTPRGVRRPVASEDTLLERAKRKDPSVINFSPFLFNPSSERFRYRLPKMEDFGGLTSCNSIKNMLFLDPAASVTPVDDGGLAPSTPLSLAFGKIDRESYNLLIRAPFSPVQAFAVCIASLDSGVRPKRQL